MSNYNKYSKKTADIETLNPKIIDEKIKSGRIGGIYCLFGDEEYMIDYYIRKILNEFMKDGESNFNFDCAVFDSDNFDVNLFRDIIASYPVMSDYKIAVIKNADFIKFKSGEKDELVKILIEYKDDIQDYACVIFKMKSLTENVGRDAPGAPQAIAATSQKGAREKTPALSLTGFLKENANLFEFKENPLASLIKWIKKIAASENTEISDENAAYILNRTEMRMYPLKNELDKLVRFVKSENRNIISREDIELLVSKKIDMEAFELTNAILDKKYGKAIESLDKLKNLKEEPANILGQISRYFCDLLTVNMAVNSGLTDNYSMSKKTGIHEYKIKLTVNSLRRYKDPADFINKSLELCRECDLKLKSTQLPDYGSIENLLFNIAGL
ncbi:MAG: DNA polymerase III subunit delta [Oscillospiraceae bacterium]|nr:DNA polymerase III subunit delta [Oscillospiraceae bacterium]